MRKLQRPAGRIDGIGAQPLLDSGAAADGIDDILKSQKEGVADGHDLRAFVLGNGIPDEL
jgi:hypothetical protein